MLRLKAIFPILVFFTLQSATAQTHISFSTSDSITLAANPNLQASGLHRFLFGSFWRDVWATPVNVRILYTDDSIGKAYSFTPFDQDSILSLPIELAELLPKNIVIDQISALNPFASIIVVPILRAVNLPYRENQLAALSEKGHFEKESLQVNTRLGILEEPWRNIPFNEYDSISYKFVGTLQMLDSLEENNHTCVDELQYLKARFIDILLGDWERSANQWQWVSVYKDGRTIWKPVPLNHQRAFIRLNGILPTIADMALPQLEHCGENISGIDNLTLTGRSLDRRLLVSFTKQTWDSLALWIQFQISDSVLLQALRQLPISIFEKEGTKLFHLLQSRRAQLPKAAEEFYKLLSANVELHGSNKAERAEIHRIGRHIVSVTIFDREDTTRTQLFQRVFHDDYTEEIRILLLGGDDIITLEGEESSTIKIIIDGGDGKNELIDKTKNRNIFASLNPLSPRGTIYYTSDPEFRITSHSDIQIIHDQASNVSGEQNKPMRLSYRDWGSEWSFSPWFDINPDDGLFIGGGPVYTRYEYHMDPYAQQMSVRAGLATRTNRYRLDAAGEFRDWFRGIRTFLQLHASQLDFSNFFGPGNETHYNQSLDNAGFYKVDQRQFFLHGALDFTLMPYVTTQIGSTLKLIDNNPQHGTLLDSLKLPLYNRSLTFLNLNAHIQTDTRNSRELPTKGMYLFVETSFVPSLLDNEHSFYMLQSEVRTYYTMKEIPSVTVAFRAVGEKLWGEHPFFESAFLGGNESLPGFERQRFSGDASIFGSVEIRASVTRIPFIVPLWSGISTFAETGRVFLTGEHSNRWHNVIGGGLWFSIIKPEYIANFSLARSEDKIAFYATTGFMF
ncbi:MAG: BamA/TamA family outer membrane protein [Bacteroidota bacterium]